MSEPTVHLFSFSYRETGIPRDDSGHGGGVVFDCRALPNPHWDEALRPHTGRDAPIVEFMEAHPEVAEFASHAAALVLHTARIYRELRRERLMVCFGCTGGRHRSVYLAEDLAGKLSGEGIPVVLHHLELEAGAGAVAETGDAVP